uniref:(California timema) hypothetical protein n=1 Tax=Timema californicum TaxID=61474 RepID=A0A7R9JGK0_TIMCA|nr:unnamed protein product [Timema californicum]
MLMFNESDLKKTWRCVSRLENMEHEGGSVQIVSRILSLFKQKTNSTSRKRASDKRLNFIIDYPSLFASVSMFESGTVSRTTEADGSARDIQKHQNG